MKKIILTFFVTVLTAGLINAQFNTGDKFASGSTHFSTGFSSQKDKNDNFTSDPTKGFFISFNTKAGYFIEQHFAVGASLNLSNSSSKLNDTKYSNSSVMVGPIVRYYTGSYESISPFAEVAAAIGSSSSKSVFDNETTKSKSTSTELSAGVGANYFFVENIALEGMLEYSFMNRKQKTDNPANVHHTTGGLNLFFGITVYFSSL